MKYCPDCGNKIEGKNFCDNCGFENNEPVSSDSLQYNNHNVNKEHPWDCENKGQKSGTFGFDFDDCSYNYDYGYNPDDKYGNVEDGAFRKVFGTVKGRVYQNIDGITQDNINNTKNRIKGGIDGGISKIKDKYNRDMDEFYEEYDNYLNEVCRKDGLDQRIRQKIWEKIEVRLDEKEEERRRKRYYEENKRQNH